MFHFGIIKNYTAALLSEFNDIEIQYQKSNGTTTSRNIPIKFSTREKSNQMDELTVEQLLSGNYNVLPRASLSLDAITKNTERIPNKNLKINTTKNPDNFEFQYNAIPYDFSYNLSIMCRGMNEATMILEQVLPKFNPHLQIDINEIPNLSEPTRVTVALLDVGTESQDYDEISQNIITVNFGIELRGNIYPPIKTIEKIKEFKMRLIENETTDVKKVVMGWDVNNTKVENEEKYYPEIENTAPQIIDILGDNLTIGTNSVSVIYTDIDSLITELTFEWHILLGNAQIIGNKDKAELNILGSGNIEIQVKITDEKGNYNTLSKIFNIN